MTEGDRPGAIGPVRAVGWSVVLALVVFAGSLANGFAYADEAIIERNPVVTDVQWEEAAFGASGPSQSDSRLLYRPVAILAFAAQWELGGGDPTLFHLVNVLLHAVATGLVAWLVLRLARMRPHTTLLNRWPGLAAMVAGGFFALHPVHVEAVANAVGQSDLWAAVGVLGAVHLYVWSPGRIWQRAVRVLGIGLCYGIGIGAREVAVVLPLLLMLVDAAGRGGVAATARIRRESMVFILMLAVLVAYLSLRWIALGTLVWGDPPAVFDGVSDTARIATALSVLPTVLMLLLVPARLSADYDPGVLGLAAPTDPAAALGAVLMVALAGLVVVAWRRLPLIGYGVAWFLVAWFVVSNLWLHTGVLASERALYLPSVGVAMVVGVGAAWVTEQVGRRAVLLVAVLIGSLFAARTTTRVPVWQSTSAVVESLSTGPRGSWRADHARALRLAEIGDLEAAIASFDAAIQKLPQRYGLLIDYASALREAGRLDEARELVGRAAEISPGRRDAWILLAELHLAQGRSREALGVAMEGVRMSGHHAALWNTASDAYRASGLLAAAIRAQRLALHLDPGDEGGAARLDELLEIVGA